MGGRPSNGGVQVGEKVGRGRRRRVEWERGSGNMRCEKGELSGRETR